jgi:hypothetical protein
LRDEGQVSGWWGAEVRKFFDGVEGFGMDVVPVGEEAGEAEDGKDGENEDVEDEEDG